MRHWMTGAIGAGILVSLLGCQAREEHPSQGALTVATTVLPHAWLVRQVGGEHVDVVCLVELGASHETYQPSDAQISRLTQARAYFRVGVAAEQGPWFAALRSSGKLKVVDLRRNVPMLAMTDHDHHHSDSEASGHEPEADEAIYQDKDPHIWLSPRLLKIQAQTIAGTLAELDPAHRVDYERNLTALQARLDQTDAALRKTLEPVRGNAFFVYHPAWGYFAHDYDLRQIALEQEGKEPSDEELTRLQQQVRQENVKVVFIQPQISSHSAQALAQAVGGRVVPIDPLEEDVAANLGHVAGVIVKSYE